MFIPTVVIDGQVRGTWKHAITAAAKHYGSYSGKTAVIFPPDDTPN